MQGKESDENQEEDELDGEGDHAGDEDRNRHCHARKVNLAKQIAIIHKGIRCLGQAIRKVGPEHRTTHIEEELGQAIGG